MKTTGWSKRLSAFVLGAMTMSLLSLVAISNAQNPFVKLVMRFGEERVLEDGTKVGVSKGDGDFIIVTLSRPAANQSTGVDLAAFGPTTRPISKQKYQRNDLVGTWESFGLDEYQNGNGKIPQSSKPGFLAEFSNSGVYKSASREDRLFTYPTIVTSWKYTAQGDKAGVYELIYHGMIAARVRLKWIDVNTFEDEILFSNEPAYIGLKRLFRRFKE